MRVCAGVLMWVRRRACFVYRGNIPVVVQNKYYIIPDVWLVRAVLKSVLFLTGNHFDYIYLCTIACNVFTTVSIYLV